MNEPHELTVMVVAPRDAPAVKYVQGEEGVTVADAVLMVSAPSSPPPKLLQVLTKTGETVVAVTRPPAVEPSRLVLVLGTVLPEVNGGQVTP